MKVRFAPLFALIMMMFGASTTFGQEQSDMITYQVVTGNYPIKIVSDVCGPNEAGNWREFINMPENASLRIPRNGAPSREFITRRGQPGYYIYPGEFIRLPATRCNRPAAGVFPVWQGGNPTPVQGVSEPSLTRADVEELLDQKLAGLVTTVPVVHNHIPWWMWVIVGLLLALLFLFIILAIVRIDNVEMTRREEENRLIDAAREDGRRTAREDMRATTSALQGNINDLRSEVAAAQQRERLRNAQDEYREFLGGDSGVTNVYNAPVYNGPVYFGPSVQTGPNNSGEITVDVHEETNVREPAFP